MPCEWHELAISRVVAQRCANPAFFPGARDKTGHKRVLSDISPFIQRSAGVPRHKARPIIQSVVWIRGRKLLPPSDCGLQSTHMKPHPNHLSNLRSGPCASWCVPCNAEGLRLSWDCRHQGAASAAQKTRAKTLRQSSFSAFTSSSLVAGAIDLVPTFRNAAANVP